MAGKAPEGELQYRLKQIDTDGTFTYYNQTVKVGRTLTSFEEETLLTEYSLEQNYPNPFNPSTSIEYIIPSNVKGEMSIVVLKIYDLLGCEVATLVNQQQKPGRYKVEFDASHLASGIYIYKLQTNDGFKECKKFVLTK